MGINVNIRSGDQHSRLAHVSSKNALLVELLPTTPPPPGTPSELLPFSQKCSDGGVTNMNVDGSTTPQNFVVNADENEDIFIVSFTIILFDSQIKENRFGFQTALTNGFDVKGNLNGVDQFTITAAKTTLDLEEYTDNNFEKLQNVDASNNSAILLVVTPGVNIRLGRGTLDKFICTVNDDLTALARLECRVKGYRQL